MPYRLELSKNARATCTAAHCKDAGTKIEKGEIRQGVLVPFGERQSWKYRHWGCVTPEVIHNWKDESQGDMELVDGYTELPVDVQEKVKRAFAQGHVDDDEWKGDVEMNRYTGKRQGMFVKNPKKQADGDDETETRAKQGGKKRAGAKAEDAADEDAKPVKKPRGKKAAKIEDEDSGAEAAPPAKKARKTRKAAEEDEEPEAEPIAKQSRAKKVKAAARDQDQELDDEEPAPAKKPRAKKAAKSANDEEDESAVKKAKPQKGKRRGKKAAADDED